MGTIDSARPLARESEWVQAHAALTRLARERAAIDAEAEALESLPVLARALDAGQVGWCAVRELTRVAVAETEAEWLATARGKTIRQLGELVANKRPGDTPEGSERHPPRSRVLRFEVAPETFALFRDAMRELRRSAGGGLDDDAVLLSMARQLLAGPRDDGRASYQISLTVCSACRRGDQLGGGEPVTVGKEVVAMAECDGQHLGPLLARADTETVARAPATATSEDGAHVGVGAPAPAGESPGGVAPEASATRAAPPAPPLARAKQNIPPAVRRAVLARDRHRCRVPACRHATFLDIHHVVPRSEGGSNDPANTITICSALGWQRLRPSRHPAAGRRSRQGLRSSAPPGLSRARGQGRPRRAPRR